MDESLQAAWFSVLFVGAIAWLLLLGALIRRLRIQHPDCYRQMGSPSLFRGFGISICGVRIYRAKGTQGDLLQILGFIYSPEVRDMGDPGLIGLCRVMRILLPAQLIGFVGFVFFSLCASYF